MNDILSFIFCLQVKFLLLGSNRKESTPKKVLFVELVLCK